MKTSCQRCGKITQGIHTCSPHYIKYKHHIMRLLDYYNSDSIEKCKVISEFRIINQIRNAKKHLLENSKIIYLNNLGKNNKEKL